VNQIQHSICTVSAVQYIPVLLKAGGDQCLDGPPQLKSCPHHEDDDHGNLQYPARTRLTDFISVTKHPAVPSGPHGSCAGDTLLALFVMTNCFPSGRGQDHVTS